MCFRKLLALALTLACLSTAARSQVSPAASQTPWNQYIATRITNAYVPIIGLPGTTRIAGSESASQNQVFTLALPFNFTFIGTIYPAGYLLRVGANGYISFQNTNTSGVPDLSASSGTAMICPYWSDVRPLNVPEGGVFWRVDGVAPARILTVEWRCQGVAAPTRNPGQFQARLYEGSNKIEFHYSGNSIDRSATVPTNGAIIGLKNVGFYTFPFPPAGNDAEKFLICPDPANSPDTVAFTRTRCVQVSLWGWFLITTPETYAGWPVDAGFPNTVSRFFAYTFPSVAGERIGYRFTSVQNDVAGDRVIYNPAHAGNVYSQGAAFQLTGQFRNLGLNARTNVPVRLDIYRTGGAVPTLLQSFTGTAFPTSTPQNGTSTVTLGSVGPSVTTLPGTYQVKMYTSMTAPPDEDPTNDTVFSTFYVAFQNDVRTAEILVPVTFGPGNPVVYPSGTPITPEIRFQNIGVLPQANVRCGYDVYDGACIRQGGGTGIIRGTMNPLEVRDVVFTGSDWTPSNPGVYYIRAWSDLAGDEQRSNDTLPSGPGCGKPFKVLYEIEVEARDAGTTPGLSPDPRADYPDNRPVDLRVAFKNNGIIDATNVPVKVEIRKGDCSSPVIFTRNIVATTIPGEASGNGTTVYYNAGYYIPKAGPGMYTVTVTATDPQDPVRQNDAVCWSFTVKPRLSGTIYVGTGERFKTIQEANDSLYRYGMSGNVDFKLVDDQYIVRPTNNDPLLPALECRGDVMGAGPNAVVTWMAVAGKTNVDIILKSPSGIGIIWGQRDTSNPTGYQVWDGGPSRLLHFLMDTAGANAPTKSIPFFLSQGSSNITLKNLRIEPRTVGLGMKGQMVIPTVTYNRTFNSFTYDKDENALVAISSGVFLRNTSPSDANGNNPGPRRRDTLRNQNNVVDNCVIKNFAYGITSVGAGPLYRVGDDAYVEYNNQNNTYRNNTIDSVSRAGIALMFEKGSLVSTNKITRVQNTSGAIQHAAGIWLSSGGRTGVDTLKNLGYSDNIRIERNKVSAISAAQGYGAGIWVETRENVFTSTSARVYRFPANNTSGITIRNNMAWNYQGLTTVTGRTAGIGMTLAGDTRIDYTPGGNKVENNTLFNQIASTAQEYGIVMQRYQGSVRNNIISILTPGSSPIGVALVGPTLKSTVSCDYNLFWVPNGWTGAMVNLAGNGFNIPSPPLGKTLNQWRALSRMDSNSIEGNVTGEYISTTPGAEDLHMRPNLIGALANNRGVNIAGLTNDIDNDPRGAAQQLQRYDIGADEFASIVRNNDVMSEDIIAPFGYRAPTGQFSDAEYMMVDSSVSFWGRFRNMGGLPQLANTVTATLDYWNGVNWVSAGTPTIGSVTTSFDVAQPKTVGFGTFQPRTLSQYGINDAYYGMNPNVTPIYRLRITSGVDDYAGNNVYEKLVRFYVRRSTRYALVSVETRQAAMPATAIDKSNKLNTDTLLAALDSIRWSRADGIGTEEYDLFDRDKWPKENLNFVPWNLVIWEQGAEPQGLEPEERVALKQQLDSRNIYNRANLIIAGQDIARIHDVALTVSNGQIADKEFVNTYLRGSYVGATLPANYNNRNMKGVAINAGKYENIRATGVAGDNDPFPALVKPTAGEGISRSTHYYNEQTFGAYVDSSAGVATAAPKRNVIYYAQDWRHYGRFSFEFSKSGAQRLLLAGLDFVNQYRGVVPVKVSSFDAKQVGLTSVQVDWKTASEKEVSTLEIERAELIRTETGVQEGTYELVDRKVPAGDVSRGASYSVTDLNVTTGTEYRYRLVSVGLDGSRSVDAYDDVKITGTSQTAGYSLTLRPNPATTATTIDVRMPESMNARVELFDGAGKLVKVVASGEVSSASYELNVEDLPSGSYTVRVTTSTGRKLMQKLSVQK